MEYRREVDGLRALAVLAVVVYHAAAPTALHAAHSQTDAVGARGVDLFFVLSGFCLSWPYASEFDFPRALTFFRRRLTRIAPTFFVALVLFAALGFTRFGLPSYGNSHVPLTVQVPELLRDLTMFLIPLDPIHDPPMWTLGIEMRWYVVFPLLLALFFRSKIGFGIAAAASYVAYAWSGFVDCATLPTFMLGIVAAALVKKELAIHRIWPFAAPIAIALGVFEQQHALMIEHASVVWALACFATVMAVTTNAVLRRVFSWQPIVGIGVASYSIYLVHQPILDSLAWAGASRAFAALASVAAGIAFWYCVERPLCSKRARRALESWLLATWHALPRKKALGDRRSATQCLIQP